jgi:YD repeat-containing protein
MRLNSRYLPRWILTCEILIAPAVPLFAQQPPDPLIDTPASPWTFVEDPAWVCDPIGWMHFPKGRLRSVTWSEGNDASTPGETVSWVKRAVLGFDDRGRCIEIESWFSGTCEYWKVLQAAGTTHPERVLEWDGVPSTCSMSEPIRNHLGLEVANLRTPWTSDGLGPKGGQPTPQALYEYDPGGRLLRVMYAHAEGGSLWQRCEIWHDERGRVRRIHYRNAPKDPGWTREFEYDERNNVSVSHIRLDNDPSLQSREYRYDDAGRLVEECLTADGRIRRTIGFEYEEDGRFLARWEVEEAPIPGWPGEPILYRRELFDGIDRPRTLTISDSLGRAIDEVRWTYRDDARGNWVEKRPKRTNCVTRPELALEEFYDILRVIEYAD